MKVLLLAGAVCSCVYAQTAIVGSRTIQSGVNVFTAGGTGNVITGTMPAGATITAYAPGVTYSTVLIGNNTGAATLNIDGVGAKPIKQADGTTDIASGTLVSGAGASFLYNGTSFQYLGGGGSSSAPSSSAIPGGTVSSAAPMYLYAHYRDDSLNLFLSYSYDGFSFKTLNPFGSLGVGFLTAPTVYYTGGTYYFLFTGPPGFVESFSSTDLLNFTTVANVAVPGIPSGTQNNWAPEFFKDPVSGNMYVAMSVENAGGTWDMYLWSWTPGGGMAGTPTLITINGTMAHKYIDPFLYYKAGTYYLFFADLDNSWPANPHVQTVTYATSSTLTGTYTVPSAIQSNRTLLGFGSSAEAPSVFDLPNGCTEIVGDTFQYLPYSFYTGFNYKPRMVTSCNNFATFSAPLDINISKAQHGTVLPLTQNAQAFTVLEAQMRSSNVLGNTTASHFGVNKIWPRYTFEVRSNASSGDLQYDEPASLAADPGDANDAIWSACSGNYGQYCPTPPASNGMWLMNSAANAFGQVQINNPTNAVSGMIFSDQATQFGPSRNGPHNWHLGENYTAGNHFFHIFDDTGNSSTRKSPFWIDPTSGQVLGTYGFALGSATWMDFTKRVSLDSPSSGVLNCGTGAVGSSDCTLNVGTLNATTINGSAGPGSSSGYANVAPNTNSATTSNIVVIGDSHMAGLTQTTSIPAQISTTYPYTVTNLSVSGTKACAYWADMGTHEAQVDALFNPKARTNILVVEGGGNDMIDNNVGSPAVPWITAQQTYDCQVAYARRRKSLGWKIVLYGMYSRGQTGIGGLTGDQLKTQLNNLYNQGSKSWTDGYVNISADPNIVADGAHSNTTYFSGDDIHINSSYTGTLAFVLSDMINHAEFGDLQTGNEIETLWPLENAVLRYRNSNSAFSGALVNEFVTNARHYYDGVTGPSATPANARYLFDATNNYFVYQIHDHDWTINAQPIFTPTSSDPGCNADGKQWVDNSDSSNSHLKMCLRRGGSLGWVTIN
jgi:hypothetical protein